MTLAEILLTLAGAVLGIAAAIGAGLGVVICISYIETLILKRNRK